MNKLIKLLLRWLPLVILVVGIALFFYFRLYTYLTFGELAKQRFTLLQWTQAHYFLSIVFFMLSYTLLVAFSFPGATLFTLLGGFLFGVPQGTLYVVVAATMGACIIFLAVKTSLGNSLAKKGSKWIVTLEKGFQENAFSYLLVLRFIPLFPFWVINIVAGVLNVRFRAYVLATFIGIIPGSLVFVAVGNGLGSLFDKGETPDFSIIFSAPVLLPLIGLSILSIVPIIYKKIKAKKNA